MCIIIEHYCSIIEQFTTFPYSGKESPYRKRKPERYTNIRKIKGIMRD